MPLVEPEDCHVDQADHALRFWLVTLGNKDEFVTLERRHEILAPSVV